MKQLMNIARALDVGYTGCMANSWGMLSYLPFMELSPKLGELTKFGQEFVMRHQYLSALVKMNQYLAYKGNIRWWNAVRSGGDQGILKKTRSKT